MTIETNPTDLRSIKTPAVNSGGTTKNTSRVLFPFCQPTEEGGFIGTKKFETFVAALRQAQSDNKSFSLAFCHLKRY